MMKPKNLDLPPSTTIAEARKIVEQNRSDAGCPCPVCDQLVAVYRRTITATMLTALGVFYQHGIKNGEQFLHFPRFTRTSHVVAGQGGDWAKLTFWELIARKEETREDGSNRNGWARITQDGVDFIERRLRVPRYIFVYNNQLVGIDTTELVGVDDLIGKKFRYDELFGAT